MAIQLNFSRQFTKVAYVDVSAADLAGLSGTAQIAVKLPPGSIITAGALVVTAAFNSGTSDALVVGDASVANRYLASTSIAAAGRTALTVTGFTTTGAQPAVNVAWTGVGAAPSAGSFRLEVHYIGRGVADFTQD
jgi:hypothetical protein